MTREGGARTRVALGIAGLIALAAAFALFRWRMPERSTFESEDTTVERADVRSGAAGEHPGSALSEPARSPPPAREPAPADLAPSPGSAPTTAAPAAAPTTAGEPARAGAASAGLPLPPAATGDDPPRGSLPADAVRSVVRDAMPELRFCFEWQLSLHPELGGRLLMEFTIDETGAVSSAHVADDLLADQTVSRCFSHVIGRLRFPPPDPPGEVLVRYPFVLSGAPAAREPEGI